MKKAFLVLSLLSTLRVFAVPEVSGVTIAKGARTGDYVVSYALSSKAIITADILTNGVSIGAARFATYSGDVFKTVEAGTRSFTWAMRTDWPDQQVVVQAKVSAWTKAGAPDYLVIDLKKPNTRFYYPSAADLPYEVTNELYKTDMLVMRRIPAAGVEWRMGQPAQGERCDGNTATAYDYMNLTNEPPHLVALTKDYYMAVFELTQRQYYNVMKTFPSSQKVGDKATLYEGSKMRPVESVSYTALRGAVSGAFAGWPTAGHAVADGSVLRTFRDFMGVESLDLPTEAQWEYACRAGTLTGLNSGLECSNSMVNQYDAHAAEVAWYGNSHGTAGGQQHHEVGLKLPNAWGLYDMHGNVCEMCLDYLTLGDDFTATFAADWKTGGVTVDPVGPQAATGLIVMRGGDYFYCSTYLRSAARACVQIATPTSVSQHYGIRLVCEAE